MITLLPYYLEWGNFFFVASLELSSGMRSCFQGSLWSLSLTHLSAQIGQFITFTIHVTETCLRRMPMHISHYVKTRITRYFLCQNTITLFICIQMIRNLGDVFLRCIEIEKWKLTWYVIVRKSSNFTTGFIINFTVPRVFRYRQIFDFISSVSS